MLAIDVDDGGNVVITGSTYVTGNRDWLTVKYSPVGESLWTDQYGNTRCSDEAYDVAMDVQGFAYVTGIVHDTLGSSDIQTIRYNLAGDTVWTRRFDGTEHAHDWGLGITLDRNRNVYTAGVTMDTSGPFWDWVTLKYDSEGRLLWCATYNGLGNRFDEAHFVAVDTANAVIVAGVSWVFGGDLDYTVIKYKQVVDVAEENRGSTAQPRLTVSPNPFRDKTVIRYDLPAHAHVSLKIYDVTGRCVKTFAAVTRKVAVVWDGRDDRGDVLPSGIYVCQARDERGVRPGSCNVTCAVLTRKK